MERGSIVKWLFLGLAIFLLMTVGKPLLFGGGKAAEKQPLGGADWSFPAQRLDDAEKQTCDLHGPRFTATVSARGASLRRVKFDDARYKSRSEDGAWYELLLGRRHDAKPIDLVTTSKEQYMPLRTDLRVPGDHQNEQLPYSDVDWKLVSSDEHKCSFEYEDENKSTLLTKTLSTTDRPFELSVAITVKNVAPEARTHRMAIEQTSWHSKKETEGGLGRMSELMSETVIHSTAAKTERHGTGDFDPDDFKDKEFTAEKWRRTSGEARWVATSSSYFTQALIAEDAPSAPAGEALIEEVWDDHRYPNKSNDPDFGHIYRSRLAYPEQKLEPQQAVTYRVLSFTGPKERDVLGAVGGGGEHAISDVINLGWFGVIGKVLVSYVYALHKLVGSWGWAICLLTISVKLLLFPLSWAQIKSSIGMRKLKPEMDAINAKYKDDATQRGLALQELWRKNKVGNPVTGCIPVLLQMPVWFALYTALQTAVELYHTPFGPFIPDLSSPGKYLIIPLVLGASSFFQQKLMPPQGDPAQQKMMMYMMPGIFTVMMLFLPAGLGVYMLTNTWLGITQQVLMERYMKAKSGGGSATIEVREKKKGDDEGKKDGSSPASGRDARPSGETSGLLETGKGKARVRG